MLPFFSGEEFIGDSDTDSDGLDVSSSFSHHLVNHKSTRRTSRSSTMSSDGGGGGGHTPSRHTHTSNGHDTSLQQSQGMASKAQKINRIFVHVWDS